MTPSEGKVAFVTGAASGIGLGVATALAQAGVKVMMCDIEAKALEAARKKLEETNADVSAVVADVSAKSELEAAAKTTIDRYGKVHILVNNAGVGGGAGYGEWTDASWDWTLGVNLRSVIWGFEIFGPLIESHGEGGQIVSTASIAGLIPATGPSYNVTKYGVVALSENLRPVLAQKNIGVSVLCPGVVSTRIMDSRRNVPESLAGQLEDIAAGAEQAALIEAVRAAIAAGVDPAYVGELVREGIEGDWPYIFTDTEWESRIEERFASIRKGFDRIRDRTPPMIDPGKAKWPADF